MQSVESRGLHGEADYLNEIRQGAVECCSHEFTGNKTTHTDSVNVSLSVCVARFKKRGRKWYNWSDAECTEKWNQYMRDPTIPKGEDQLLGL